MNRTLLWRISVITLVLASIGIVATYASKNAQRRREDQRRQESAHRRAQLWRELRQAVQDKDIEAVKRLAPQFSRDGKEAPDPVVLIDAAHFGFEPGVKLLLNYGWDPNGRPDFVGHPLHSAAERGHVDVLKCLLDRGAELNSNAVGESALVGAARTGYLQTVKFLLSKGADISLRGYDGKTASEIARVKGFSAIEQELKAAVLTGQVNR
jgi:ankyrin repeat protein